MNVYRPFFLLASLFYLHLFANAQFSVSGTIDDGSGANLVDARVTLYNADTSLWMETRSGPAGNYSFSGILQGNYTVAATTFDREYKDSLIAVNGNFSGLNFSIAADTHPGQWQIIMTAPEALGGTDMGILLPNGKTFYCHDTEDPFLFDPTIDDTLLINGDDSVQGCVGPSLMPNGNIIFLGGALVPVYGPGSKKVKIWDAGNGSWNTTGPLNDFRWYPSLAQLPNGKILLAGGGDENNPNRTNTSEVYDPATGTSKLVDTLAIGNEVSPICLMLNGKVLMTHRPPQLFDPATEQWDSASDFVQGNRMANGDHADHELTMLEDGRVVAIGFKSFTQSPGNLTEIYDPTLNSWTLGANFSPVRSRCMSVYLPNQKILVLGGEKEDATDPTPTNQWNFMALADIYDPVADSWRRLAPMNIAREYHLTGIVVPDGRVVVVGGEGQPGNKPDSSVIETYTPYYLNKGVRPEIHALQKTTFQRGELVNFDVQFADSVTQVIIMSNAVVTHNMNCGNNRYFDLNFTQNGNSISATIPTDTLGAIDGYYMLIVMVEDIPSVASIIKVMGDLPMVSNSNDTKDLLLPTVYPNPNDGKFTLQIIDRHAELETVELLDQTGKSIRKWDSGLYNLLGLGRMEFDLDLPAGIYFIRINNQTREKAVRFIVN